MELQTFARLNGHSDRSVRYYQVRLMSGYLDQLGALRPGSGTVVSEVEIDSELSTRADELGNRAGSPLRVQGLWLSCSLFGFRNTMFDLPLLWLPLLGFGYKLVGCGLTLWTSFTSAN